VFVGNAGEFIGTTAHYLATLQEVQMVYVMLDFSFDWFDFIYSRTRL
jgi:hypothetical protein